MRSSPHRHRAAASLVALSLVLPFAACNASKALQTAHLNQECARDCEQRFDQCIAKCPDEAGAQLGCRMKVCNPGRGSCLKECPPASFD